MLAIFQIEGMSQCAMDKLKRAHRYEVPCGPRLRRWRMFSLSGPHADEFIWFIGHMVGLEGLLRSL